MPAAGSPVKRSGTAGNRGGDVIIPVDRGGSKGSLPQKSGLPDGVEKTVEVHTPKGIQLLYLYKVGKEAVMFDNAELGGVQVLAYKLRPRDYGGIRLGDDIIFISDVPSLAGYTFKVVNRAKYIGFDAGWRVTRLT